MTTMPGSTTSGNTPNGVLSICCLGKTGVGKSTLLNRLLGDISLKGDQLEGGFKAKRSTKSVTKRIHAHESTFKFKNEELKKYNNQYYKLVDTPGLNDSEGGDKVLVDRVVDFFKQTCNGVNIFLILLKVDDCRVCSNTIGMLKLLEELFGKNYWKNVMIVFTRYDITSHGDCDDSDEFDANMKDISEKICQKFGLNFDLPVACVGRRNYVSGINTILTTGLRKNVFTCQYMKGWNELSNQKDKEAQQKKMNELLRKIADLEHKIDNVNQPNQNSGFRVFKAVGSALDDTTNWVGRTVRSTCAIM